MTQDQAAERASYELRRVMVDNQIRTFEVTDQRLLDILYQTPRESFLPAFLKPLAYSDVPLTLPAGDGGEGRVLMPPMILARMIQNARYEATSRALVVASATGYAAAVLAPLVASVTALDSDSAFSEAARQAVGSRENIEVVTGRMPAGHAAGAPYDVILVNGAVEDNMDGLFGQLAPGGSLVVVDAKFGTATRRSGRAMRYDNVAGDISPRALFDATLPVLPEFRRAAAFAF